MRRPATDAVDGLERLLRVLLELRRIGPSLPAVAAAILVYLRLRAEKAARMEELQELLDISQQRTSSLCRSLASKGLVRLTPLPEDRRAVRVQLTAKSLRLIDE